MRARHAIPAALSLALGCCVSVSLGKVTYTPGMVWDSWSVSGPPNTRFDVELHHYRCTWRVVDSGKTDSSGNDSGRVWHFGPGNGYQPFHTDVRVHFSSCTTQGGTLETPWWSVNANVSNSRVQYQAGCAGTSGPHSIAFAQNTAELIAATGQAAWLPPGTFFTIRLPRHFTFDGLPAVQALNPADLVLGPASLAEDGRTLVVPVLDNARQDPFDGLSLENVFIFFDGDALPDFYWPMIAATFDITPAGAPFEPTATIHTESGYRGMVVHDTPALEWFDDTLGGADIPSFFDIQTAHGVWSGTPDAIVDFEGFPFGTKITNQYDPLGVWFTGTSGGALDTLTGVQQEGDPELVQDLTGYDGTYQPDGSNVYIRFQNTVENPDAPVTFTFGTPQHRVAGFIACGVEGLDHSFTVTAYGDDDEVLGTRVYTARLWEADPALQNQETFFGVQSTVPEIRAVSIRNNSTTQFADTLILDNVAWETWPSTSFGDYDRDGDVDAADYSALELCLSGPAEGADFVVPDSDCRYAFDGDGDTDSDLADCAAFAPLFTGEVTQLPPPRALSGTPGASGEVELAWLTPMFEVPAGAATEPAYEFRASAAYITPANWSAASPVAGDLPPVAVNAGWTVNLHVDAQCKQEGITVLLDQVYMRAWLSVQVHAGNLYPWGFAVRNETITFNVYDENDNLVVTGTGVTDSTGMAQFNTGDVNDDHDCSQPNWPLYTFEAYWAGHSIGLWSGQVVTSGDKTDTEDMMVCDGTFVIPPAGSWGQFGGTYSHLLGDVTVEICLPAGALTVPEIPVVVYEPAAVPPPAGMPPGVPGPMFAFTVEKADGPYLEKAVVFTVMYPPQLLDEYGGLGESSLRAYRYDEQALLWMPLDLPPVAIDRENHQFRFATTMLGLLALAAEIDEDHDGLGNEEEAAAGLLPNEPDTDSDGVFDGDEVWFSGGDPLNPHKLARADQAGLASGLPPGTGVFIAGRIVWGDLQSELSNCIYVPLTKEGSAPSAAPPGPTDRE